MTEQDGGSLFAWVHVSDIHLGHGTVDWRYDQELVLSAVIEDVVAGIDAERFPRPDAVICTGDVANTGALGRKDEYERAAAWLHDLRERSGATELFVVPGNHDIQRTPPGKRDAFRLIDRLRLEQESLDAAREYKPDRVQLDKRLTNFSSFSAHEGCPQPLDTLGAWSATVDTGDPAIRLVGFNTASLCNDDDDERKLAVTRSAVGEAHQAARDGALVIALAHHPPSWLASASRNAFETLLAASPSIPVFIHGHIHKQGSVRTIDGAGGQLITVIAGAVHDDEGGVVTHAFNVTAVWKDATGALSLRIWPRRWSPNGRFVIDVDAVPDGASVAVHPIVTPRPQESVTDQTVLTRPKTSDLGCTKFGARAGSVRRGFNTAVGGAEQRSGWQSDVRSACGGRGWVLCDAI